MTTATTATTTSSPCRIPARSRLLRLLLPVLLAVPLAGCVQTGATFDPGLGTWLVKGQVQLARAEPGAGAALIVVFRYHHQFVTQGDGSAVLHPSAQVLPLGHGGGYRIPVPADVVRMDVLFIAPEHLTDLFRFQRQIGVGEITYRPVLRRMPDWRSHYYTFLTPQLEALIVDTRYRLPPQDVQRLSDWLQAQNDRLGAATRGS